MSADDDASVGGDQVDRRDDPHLVGSGFDLGDPSGRPDGVSWPEFGLEPEAKLRHVRESEPVGDGVGHDATGEQPLPEDALVTGRDGVRVVVVKRIEVTARTSELDEVAPFDASYPHLRGRFADSNLVARNRGRDGHGQESSEVFRVSMSVDLSVSTHVSALSVNFVAKTAKVISSP